MDLSASGALIAVSVTDSNGEVKTDSNAVYGTDSDSSITMVEELKDAIQADSPNEEYIS